MATSTAAPSNYRHRLPAAIERLDQMPALAESRNRVLGVLSDEDAGSDDLVTAVESDVALVIAVMRLANTDQRKRGRVATVGDAVRILTPEGIDTLARRIGVYGFFERIPGWEMPPERFRLHSVAVAGTADMIAREIDHPRPDELFVAALLHDLGKVVMADAYPGYRDRMSDPGLSPDERARAERREFGVDHAVIGGVMLRRWRLPQVIARAVERHHSADADGEAAVVRLADALTHYELGEAVRPAELEQAAAQLGLDLPALESLMYRLPERSERRRRNASRSPLSGQEREVLKGLAASKVYKEIAFDLGIASSTVRSHLHNVYAKLGAADRAQAVLIASREGWI
jgi:putative nucleotidyltransferase with HDIG domain